MAWANCGQLEKLCSPWLQVEIAVPECARVFTFCLLGTSQALDTGRFQGSLFMRPKWADLIHSLEGPVDLVCDGPPAHQRERTIERHVIQMKPGRLVGRSGRALWLNQVLCMTQDVSSIGDSGLHELNGMSRSVAAPCDGGMAADRRRDRDGA